MQRTCQDHTVADSNPACVEATPHSFVHHWLKMTLSATGVANERYG